jgi:RNA-directed DNA polymerase
MKRLNLSLEQIADRENLYFATWKAAIGKRHSEEVQFFMANIENELTLMASQILSGYIDVGNYRYFVVYEPKERKICASVFRENVLHHAIMNVCHHMFERQLIHDTYASRIDKGIYKALDQAQRYTRANEWFLKLDVRKFFDQIHHNVLKRQLDRICKSVPIFLLFDKIIDSYESEPDRGVPIGNLTSQYFANHYLSPLDHFIKETLGAKCYVRYMDDMVLWSNDKAELKQWLVAINRYVEQQLLCTLKEPILQRSNVGLPFLGYRVLDRRLRLLPQSKRRFFKKASEIEENYHSGEWSEAYCRQRMEPLLAFVQHADTKSLLQSYFYPRSRT